MFVCPRLVGLVVVGCFEGAAVGTEEGSLEVGLALGCDEGELLGWHVGLLVGWSKG